MELIDKADLVVRVEKLQSEIAEEKKLHGDNSMWYNGINHGFNLVKDILDTLEVKEVDLEEELESFAYTLPHSAIGDGKHLGKFDDPKVKEARKNGWSHLWRYNYVKEIAKHFFELGLKAQKGEEI